MNSQLFSDLPLIPALQRALAEQEYSIPTPIQAAAIPPLLEGRDLLGCAQTGTGKTAAFALPILQRLDAARKPAAPHEPRVLVLAPTRELAAQIHASFQAYGRHLHLRHAVVYGGVAFGPQARALARGLHVLIATPGRLLDHMQQGNVRLDRLDVFVLDEADRMLDMGFLPDLKRIVARLPRRRQSLFFSATMPASIAGLAQGLLTDPVQVHVTPQVATVPAIEQRVLFVGTSDKRALLRRFLDQRTHGRVLVFTRTKHGADRVAKQLVQGGHVAAAIHGNKSQNARQRTLDQFRDGSLRVLVATDLAARGLDVEGISHVINFDMPHEPETYVHRIGRTGRAGATGIALSFCDTSERGALYAIERLIRCSLEVDADHPFHLELEAVAAPRPAARRRPEPRYSQGRPPEGYASRRRPARAR